jgi:hypothetical protein
MRIVDPELPQSRAADGWSNSPPRPSISTIPFAGFDISHPNARMHFSVLWQSAPVEKFSNRVFPLAMPASIAYRCEMDLSPGNRSAPVMFFAGFTICIEPDFMLTAMPFVSTRPELPAGVLQFLLNTFG